MGCYYLFFFFCVVSAGISYLRILTKNCVVGTQNACRLAGLNACVQQFIRKPPKEKRGVPPAVPHHRRLLRLIVHLNMLSLPKCLVICHEKIVIYHNNYITTTNSLTCDMSDVCIRA